MKKLTICLMFAFAAAACGPMEDDRAKATSTGVTDNAPSNPNSPSDSSSPTPCPTCPTPCPTCPTGNCPTPPVDKCAGMDCGDGKVCSEGQCYVVASCDNVKCPAGQTCEDTGTDGGHVFQCVGKSYGPCKGTGWCEKGSVCCPDDTTGKGVCKPLEESGCTMECTDTHNCVGPAEPACSLVCNNRCKLRPVGNI